MIFFSSIIDDPTANGILTYKQEINETTFIAVTISNLHYEQLSLLEDIKNDIAENPAYM